MASRSGRIGDSQNPPEHQHERTVVDRVGDHGGDERVAPFAQQRKADSDARESGDGEKSLGMQSGEDHTGEQCRGKEAETAPEVTMERASEKDLFKDRCKSRRESESGELRPEVPVIHPADDGMSLRTDRFSSARRRAARQQGTAALLKQTGKVGEEEHQ